MEYRLRLARSRGDERQFRLKLARSREGGPEAANRSIREGMADASAPVRRRAGLTPLLIGATNRLRLARSREGGRQLWLADYMEYRLRLARSREGSRLDATAHWRDKPAEASALREKAGRLDTTLFIGATNRLRLARSREGGPEAANRSIREGMADASAPVRRRAGLTPLLIGATKPAEASALARRRAPIVVGGLHGIPAEASALARRQTAAASGSTPARAP